MSAPVIPLRAEPCEIFDLHAHMLKRERIGDRDLQRSHELAEAERVIDECALAMQDAIEARDDIINVHQLEKIMDVIKQRRSCKP